MTVIHVPMQMDDTFVVESYEDGKRHRWTITRFIKSDGDVHIHTDCEEVPDEGPLTIVMPGPDVDNIAIRDMLQAAKAKPKYKRERPDITRMYQEFNERRVRELDTKTVHVNAKW